MKKRIISVILCVVMLLSVIPLNISLAAEMGDLDGNGKLESSDARTVLRAAVGLDNLTDEQFILADTDGNGKIESSDARAVLRAAVGLEPLKPLHTHSYTSKVTTKATCTADGVETFTCSCGEAYTKAIAKTGHKQATKNTDVVAATCNKAGSYNLVTYCTTCNATIKSEKKTTPATGNHSWKDATCTAPKTCTVCNTTTGNKANHTTATRNENVVAATCNKAGSYTLVTYCTSCKATVKTENKTTPATGNHSWKDATCTAPKTCKNCGTTTGNKAGHSTATRNENVVPATCKNTGSYTLVTYCTNCNAITNTENKTIPVTDNHDWKDATCTAPRTCKLCNKTEGEPVHSQVITLPAKNKTCSVPGLTEGKKCTACNTVVVEQETIPASHTEVTIPAVAPTCTETGLTEWVACSACDETIVEAEAVDALGHTPVEIPATPPTCTTDGNTAGEKCSVCDTITIEPEKIDATGHGEAVLDPETVIEETEEEDGYTGDKICIVCNEVAETGTAIHALEIDYIEPDCITNGYEIMKCRRCSYISPDHYVEKEEPKGHTHSDKVEYKATCTSQGYSESICTTCNASFRDDYKDALGHTYNWGTPTPSTCLVAGSREGECITCHEKTTQLLSLAACKAGEPVRVTGSGSTPCVDVYSCRLCGKFMYEIENHEMVDIPGSEVFPEFPCTINTTIDLRCKYCNKTETEIIMEATGHEAMPDAENSEWATCTTEGKMVYHGSCAVCGEDLDGKTVIIPEKGHIPTGEQTCTTSITCAREDCGDVIHEAFGHSMTVKGWTSAAHTFFCDRCGDATDTTTAGKIANFNLLTASYKQNNRFKYNTVRYFTKSYTDSSYKSFDFGIYTSMIEDMYKEEIGKSEPEYTPVRVTTVKSMYISENDISTLTADDLESITIERLSHLYGNEILADFTPSYAESSTSFTNFNKYRSLKINQNVIKVTLNIKNENLYNVVKNNIEETALMRIYDFDIRDQVTGYDFTGSKFVESETQKGDGYEMSMDMTVEAIDTDAVITYYFLEDTYEPILAIYDLYDTIDSSVNMVFKIGISIKGKMRPVITTHNTSAFVFENTIENFVTKD